MAYDEHGNYYFDPVNDMEDSELMADEAKRQVARDAVQRQQKAAQENQAVGNMWQETLKEEGIDPQTYEQLYHSDPDLAKDLMRQGMQHLAKGIKRGRDAKGRFTKPETQRVQKPQPDSQSNIAAVREKAKTGNLSYEDELSIIDSLFD